MDDESSDREWAVECKDCGFRRGDLTYREAVAARSEHADSSPSCQMILLIGPGGQVQ
jgi:hypothetical protein